MTHVVNHGFPIPIDYPSKVYVRSITFNQASYIKDCLNGVTMQETNFPFVHHVIDDASTDGTQDVIREYMQANCEMEYASFFDNDLSSIIVAKNRKNTNCTIVVYFLKHNMFTDPRKRDLFTPWRDSCTYEALCEGDDYWTDSHKLQKQVDWMDSHDDFSLCYSNVSVFNVQSGLFQEDDISNGAPPITSIIDIAHHNYIHTPSVLFRVDSSVESQLESLGPISLGDHPRWILYAERGKLFKFEEKMVVYRIGSGFWSTASFLERLVKTIVMLSKLRMVVNSSEVKDILDSQIKNYQDLAISEYNSVINSKSYQLANKVMAIIGLVRNH